MKAEKIIDKLKSAELDLVYKLLLIILGLTVVFSYLWASKFKDRETPEPIKVHVKGGVANPGLYELDEGSCIDDLVLAAGGFADNADTESINLAERVLDTEEIFIPVKAKLQQTSELININEADEKTLQMLPGIGEAYAKRIVEYRSKYGRFKTAESLLNVKGIGKSRLDKIKALITVE